MSNSPAARQLKTAAMFLMVISAISVICYLFLILAGAGAGLSTANAIKDIGAGDRMAAIAANSDSVIMSIIFLMASANVFYGALKMFKFENYRWSIAAAVISLVPCLSPCYFLGIPFGIWAIILMMKDEVKGAFPP